MGERGPISLKMAIPNGFFGLGAPMKNNVAGARTVAAALQQVQGIAAALPQGADGQPQISIAPPAPQLAAPYTQQPYAQQPSLPPQNAPGYASVPPPVSAGSYGAAPAPMPFAPPQQGNVPPGSWS